jgi:hypothetical protein
VDFDAVEASLHRVPGSAHVLLHEIGHFFGLQGTRSDEGHQRAFAFFVLDKRFAGGPYGRGRDGKHAVRL